MEKIMHIMVKDVSPRCLSDDAAKKLNVLIEENIDSEDGIVLDFSEINMFASVYFNNSMAKLLSSHDAAFIKSRISIVNLNEAGSKAFKRSMDNAAIYFGLDEDARRMVDGIVASASGEDEI